MITVIKCWFSRVLHAITALESCYGRLLCGNGNKLLAKFGIV